MFEPLAQQVQASAWVLPDEASLEACEAFLSSAKSTVDTPQEARLQIVDTLGLLLKAFAGMTQTPRQAVQSCGIAMQAIAHAQQQALAQTLETLADVGAAGCQEFGRSRRGWRTDVGDEVGN